MMFQEVSKNTERFIEQMQEQVLVIKNLMQRTLVKRFVSRRFTISVMRHLLRIMVNLQIAQITDIG